MTRQAVAEEPPYEISPVVLNQSFSWLSDRVLVRGQLSLRRSKRRCFRFGLSGILILACVAVVIFTIVATAFDAWFSDAPTEMMALTASSIYALVASTLAILSFVPLISGGRLSVRFLNAIVLNVIVFAIFLATATGFGGNDIELDEVSEIGLIILSFVLGVALIAVSLQFWSSIAMKPLPSDLDPPSRTSILDLMELMFVVACTIAFLRFAAPADDMTLTMVTSGAIGICFGIQLIPFFLGYFAKPIHWRLLALAFGLTFIVAGTCVALIIAQEDGTIVSGSATLTIPLGGLLGASVYLAAAITAFGWLRGCGWAVVRRPRKIAVAINEDGPSL